MSRAAPRWTILPPGQTVAYERLLDTLDAALAAASLGVRLGTADIERLRKARARFADAVRADEASRAEWAEFAEAHASLAPARGDAR